jgi:hypothetical protein
MATTLATSGIDKLLSEAIATRVGTSSMSILLVVSVTIELRSTAS